MTALDRVSFDETAPYHTAGRASCETMSSDQRSSRVSTASVTIALVVVLLLAAIAGVVALDRPRIESVDNDWGTVTQNQTEIETQVRISNPRLVNLAEPVFDLTYTVSLNDVQIAQNRVRSVQFSGGPETIVNVSTYANNDDIPEWWASHIQRNETTTVRVEPDGVIQPLGITLPMDSRTRTRTVRTDLLAPLQTDEPRRFRRFGRTLLVVNSTDARWGNATVNRTVMHASATVTNPTPVPLPVIDIGYEIYMNGIKVGQSTENQRTVIPPGGTRTIETEAVIDNNKLDEWWVTHLRRNETTRLRVDFFATVDVFGQRIRTPLDFLSYTRTFHTDFFGSANDSGSTNRTNASNVPPPTASESGR